MLSDLGLPVSARAKVHSTAGGAREFIAYYVRSDFTGFRLVRSTK